MIGRDDRKARGRALGALAVALTAPVLVVLAVALTRTGVVPVEVGLGVLTLTVARLVAYAALAVAIVAVLLGLKNFRAGGKYAVIALVVAGATVAGFVVQGQSLAEPSPLDVTTNVGDPPPLLARMTPQGVPQTCEGVVFLPTQIEPDRVTSAMQANAFTVASARLFQVEASRQAFWFGRRYDAVVRIRPGRTDLRVTAQGDRPDGGATCRLAQALMADLQAGA